MLSGLIFGATPDAVVAVAAADAASAAGVAAGAGSSLASSARTSSNSALASVASRLRGEQIRQRQVGLCIFRAQPDCSADLIFRLGGLAFLSEHLAQIEIVVGAVRLECYRGAVLIFGQSALVLIAIEVAERGMGRRVFRIDLEDLHELDLRVARLVLECVEISERDLGARIVRLELHRVLESLFRVGELRRLHIGVALGKEILGGLVMASRPYQDHRAGHDHRPGPGQ